MVEGQNHTELYPLYKTTTAKRCAYRSIKNICYLVRQNEIASQEGSLCCLSCDEVGDVLKGEQRHGSSPPGAKEAGKDSWRLGMKPYFLLCVSLGQESHQVQASPFAHLLAQLTQMNVPLLELLFFLKYPFLVFLCLSPMLNFLPVQSGAAWSGLLTTRHTSTALLAIATGICMALFSPFLEDYVNS